MTTTVEAFLAEVSRFGLVSSEVLSEYESSRADRSVSELISDFERRRLLTRFQTSALVEGRGASLRIGNYVLLDQIGSGGMGMVYKARHFRIERLVALKVISPATMTSPLAVQRFLREVEAVARLSHENIVAALDAGESEGRHFLVMEYVRGRDLARTVRELGPLAVHHALEYVIQAAAGLREAHRAGIIHRDVKPANLLLEESGTIKILDLGLVRLDAESIQTLSSESESTGLTQSGTIMGTADYMSPEQAVDTKHADARSDVYSLGCTLHYLLTGRPVYGGDTVMKKLLGHREMPIPTISRLRPDVPAALDAIFRRLIAKNPADRPQSMSAVIDELTRWTQSAGEEYGSRDTAALSTPSASLSQDETKSLGRGGSSPPTLDKPPTESTARISHRLRNPRERSLRSNPRTWIAAVVLSALLLGVALLLGQPWRTRRPPVAARDPAPQSAGTETRPQGQTARVALAALPPLPAGEPATHALPGLAVSTPAIPGMHRWQIETTQMRKGSTCVAWAPDNRHVVVGGHEGDLRIYDTHGWKLQQVLVGHKGSIVDVDWNPEGSRIASICSQGSVRLWGADGAAGPVLAGNFQDALAWSPDGRWLAVSAVDHAELWTAAGDPHLQFPAQGGPLRDLAFNPDGMQLATTAGSRLKVWNIDGTPSERIIDFDHRDEVRRIAWSRRDTIAATVRHESATKVYLHRRDESEPSVACRYGDYLAWDPREERLAISGEYSVSIVSSDGAFAVTEQDLGPGRFVAWSPDGRHVSFITALLAADWEPFGELNAHPSTLEKPSIDLHPDAVRVTTAHADGLRFWGSNGDVQRQIALDEKTPKSLRWSHDGGTLAMGIDADVALWTEGTGVRKLVKLEYAASYAHEIAWNPDDRTFIVAAFLPTAFVYDLQGKPGRHLTGHTRWINCPAWGSTGQIATGDEAATIRLWDNEGTLKRTIDLSPEGLHRGIAALEWSPDGRRLAAGTQATTAEAHLALLDQAGDLVSIGGKSDGVLSLAWSPTGDHLAVGMLKTGLEITSPDGKLESIIPDAGGGITALHWTKDNRVIGWVGQNQTLTCWDPQTGKTLWRVIASRDGGTVTIDSEGRVLHESGKPSIETVAYLVERVPGKVEVVSPHEFKALRQPIHP